MQESFTSKVRLGREPISWTSFIRTLIDPLFVVGALYVISLIYYEPFNRPEKVLALITVALMYPASARLARLRSWSFRDFTLNWIAVLAVLFVLGWMTTSFDLYHLRAVLLWALSVPPFLFVIHGLLPWVAPRLAEDTARRRVVIAGASTLGCQLAGQLQGDPLSGMRVVGFFDDRAPERLGAIEQGPVLGRLTDLSEYVKGNDIEVIFVALPMASQPRILKLLEDLRDTTASIYFVPDIFISDLIQARIDHVGGLPVVAVCETPFYGVTGVVKRMEDIVVSSLILLLASPLMLLVAAGIKLTSPGPVLFKQRRYGLNGKEILVYKFRSMRVMEDGPNVPQAKRNDPRVTPFGTFLRKTSLDELPQLFNVLEGSMSLVGPRPHAVAHNEQYRKLIRGYMIRHKVKPGITGLAQVNGCRGETDSVEKMQERVEFDLAYLRNWSLGLDLAIIARTAVEVLRGRNAH